MNNESINPIIKTNNDTNIELHKNGKKNINVTNKMDDNFVVPRYGTTIDLKTRLYGTSK